jgi:Ala-tRNA(Pro) deacylase
MPAQKLRTFLDQQRIKYVLTHHSPAFTAQEVAESTHVSGDEPRRWWYEPTAIW